MNDKSLAGPYFTFEEYCEIESGVSTLHRGNPPENLTDRLWNNNLIDNGESK